MSEYQYYEFQAIDRPLTNDEIRELRGYSSRAEITSTSFAVEYNWGDFKGDPHRWMEKYFDAFVYAANWGTRWFMLRIPKHLLAAEIVSEYCADDYLSFSAKGENVVLSFRSDDEDPEWTDGAGWLSSFISLRSDLMRGDYRCLYLAWLRSIHGCDFEDDAGDDVQEPPVPPGLGKLNAPLERLADFLGIDFDLIAAAAEQSKDEQQLRLSEEEVIAWVSNLAFEDKETLLVRIINDDASHPEAELRQRAFREIDAKRQTGSGSQERRSARHILACAEAIAEDRRSIEAERAARDQARRKQRQRRNDQNTWNPLSGRETICGPKPTS